MMNPISDASAAISVVQSTGTLAPRQTAPAEQVQPVGAGVKTGADPRPAPQVSRDTMESAARQIDSLVKTMGRSLSFSVDQTTGRSVLRVVDPETKEVIRQLPPEETLEIAKRLEYVNSVLVRQKA